MWDVSRFEFSPAIDGNGKIPSCTEKIIYEWWMFIHSAIWHLKRSPVLTLAVQGFQEGKQLRLRGNLIQLGGNVEKKETSLLVAETMWTYLKKKNQRLAWSLPQNKPKY